MAYTILQGNLEGTRRKGTPRNNWMTNINKSTNKPINELLQTRRMWKKCYESKLYLAIDHL